MFQALFYKWDTTLRVGAPADLVTLGADGTIQTVWQCGQEVSST